MTDLVDQVLEFVSKRPPCPTWRVHEEFRKPPQEVSACLDYLRRQGKLFQVALGQWAPQRPLDPLTGGRAEFSARLKTVEKFPPGLKRCPGCKEMKHRSAFNSGLCKPCRREYNRAYSQKRREASA